MHSNRSNLGQAIRQLLCRAVAPPQWLAGKEGMRIGHFSLHGDGPQPDPSAAVHHSLTLN